MINQIEAIYLDIIRGKSQGAAVSTIKFFLYILSWIYGSFVYVKNKGYDLGLFKGWRLPSQAVISIGNITVGGTGKTPLTLMLGRKLSQRFSTAILSRGYRSQAERLSKPLILSCGLGPEYPADICGDEPYLLAENLPHAAIYVGKDRCKAAEMAANFGAELLILDDGMQHRKIARDLEIVVMDAKDPFGQGYYLPRGLLREDVRSLRRADLIVLNHIASEEHYCILKEKIAAYSDAPVIGAHPMVAMMRGADELPIEEIQGKKAGMFCGIANPDNFLHSLQTMGLSIVEQLRLGDHMAVGDEVISNFSSRCQMLGAEFLVCTEKDKVKLDKNLHLSLPLLWVKMELRIAEGLEYWQTFIDKAETTIMNKKSRKNAA